MQTIYDSDERVHYKRQVAQRFDRAAHTYDAYADFQRIVLDRLIGLLPCTQANAVLDIGTGTGQALTPLSKLGASLVALDLSFQMLETARYQAKNPTVSFVCADAEALPITDNAFELIFSSLALQWCQNIPTLFAELYRTTKPGGHLVFSTLCKGSMPEIEVAWSGIDDEPHVNQYPAKESLEDQLKATQWHVLSSELVTVPMWFESPEAAIHSLKKVGASLVVSGNKASMAPSKWKSFIRRYEQLRESSGIPLCYQVAFFVVQKPMS